MELCLRNQVEPGKYIFLLHIEILIKMSKLMHGHLESIYVDDQWINEMETKRISTLHENN